MSDIVVSESEDVGSIRFRSRGKSTVGTETLPGGCPMSSTEMNGETPDEHDIWSESPSNEVAS
jgi:hypothetical protein